mgnify:FL=1
MFGGEASFGLDIGFETLKLVQLNRGRNIALRGAVDFPITARLLEKDRFRDKQVTADMIKKACAAAKPHQITAKKIISALPETFVFSKTIQMPKMSDKEYQTAVPSEATKYLPIPIDEVYIDYQKLIVHPDEPLIDLLLVAAPKRLVDDYVEVAKMAGCELAALETKPLAVGRALIPARNNRGILILEIGTEVSRISIWDSGKIRLATTVGVGKNQIANAVGISPNQGLNDGSFEEPIRKSGVLKPIIDEITVTIRYHQNRDYHPKPIEEIMLCGSGSKFLGIDKFIQSETKIKTNIISPHLSGDSKLDTSFTTAYGLALRKEI